ncbi:MAG: TetR/AcrR family transcriptional regulator [Enterococcaceae bacterium]|jgi:AcrR family transcriptional regulator|nr:TetR/AcrR family transcriptional regulator [Enterococcaceae bacterium]MCI1919507.1 TetR/AcrR family transcriptional regulator [Enterococcaceae bacterium]
MKYDLSKKPTRGAQRTLDDFSRTMFDLIAEKSFDEINVNEICKISNYPRATFYNYFDDKFDLLNYCWYVLSSEIKLEEFQNLPTEQLLTIYFDRIYSLLSDEKGRLDKTLRNNGINGQVVNSLKSYLQKQMREIFYICIETHPHPLQDHVPIELLSDHYSNTLILILEWVFFKQNQIDKKEAHQYLMYLLKNTSL